MLLPLEPQVHEREHVGLPDLVLIGTARVDVLGDLHAWALASAVIGLPFLMLMPMFGAALLALAIVLALIARTLRA